MSQTRAELQARYDRVLEEYDAMDRFTDRHPYPSGLDKLMSLRRELNWLKGQLDARAKAPDEH